MKKLLALVCMITCIFGLTACGSEVVYTEYEQQKINIASQMATEQVVGMFLQCTDDAQQAVFDDYTVEEIQYIVFNQYGLNIESGFAFLTAIESFDSALDEIGSVVSIGDTTAEIDDDQIIVYVDVVGELKNAEAEIIISNDMFRIVESAALNPVSTFGDLMGKAALNTLIGMGTVFLVLILISLIISCFALIPKIQAKLSKKKEEPKQNGIDNAVAQIATLEENVGESDDLELVAVIAAAIAAYEGSASPDDFVVRSIRKVNRSRR
uniref:OadG family transporter subunit n=1 Tax=Acetatifactor sp. TaxID=1872090 RepID=UPI004055FF7B